MNLTWCHRTEEQYRFMTNHFSPFFDEEQYLRDKSFHCCEVRNTETLAAVSMVQLQYEFNRLRLLYTLVHPSFRRRGINSLIKDAVEKKARQCGVAYLYAHVRESNEASLQSLLKSGFILFDEGDAFYKNGERKLALKKVLA